MSCYKNYSNLPIALSKSPLGEDIGAAKPARSPSRGRFSSLGRLELVAEPGLVMTLSKTPDNPASG